MVIRNPGFYGSFRCLGGSCPLTCCRDWDIVVDEAALRDYQRAPAGLRETIAANLVRDKEGDVCFCLTREGTCALLDGDGLCAIQRQWGEQHLCVHCGAYPRFVEEYGCMTEGSLAVSCPEAARLTMERGIFPLWKAEDGEENPPFEGVDSRFLKALLESREHIYTMLARRDCSIWARLAEMLDYAAFLQLRSGSGDVTPPAADRQRGVRPNRVPRRLRALAVRLLEFLSVLEPLRPQWPALLRQRAGELSVLAPAKYSDLTRRCAAAHPKWELHLERLAEALIFHHWPKAVNDGDIYGRAAFVAAACLALHHLALLAWREEPGFSDAGECLLWAQFSREVEHLDKNFYALCDALNDPVEWPLASSFHAH